MRIHNIKIAKRFHERLVDGQKIFEVRLNDRDYQVGDLINFTVLDDKYPALVRVLTPEPFAEPESFRITYTHQGHGLVKGFILLGVVKEGHLNERWLAPMDVI